MDLSRFDTDEEKEDKGVWRELGDGKVLLARLGNPAFQELSAQLYRKHRLALEEVCDTPEKVRAQADLSKRMTAEALSRTVLLGWSGLTLKGAPLPYSQEAAYKMLLMRSFANLIMQLSNEAEAYARQEEEQAEKNSELPSAGDGSGEQNSTSS